MAESGKTAATVIRPNFLPIDKLGCAIRDGHIRAQKGGREWLEGSLEVAASLYAAREHFASDRLLSQWLKDSGYSFYKKNDRAALVAMGADIQIMRAVLNKTTSRSYRLIYQAEKSRFPNPGKPDQDSEPTRKTRVRKPRTTHRRAQKRASKAMKHAIRMEKLGEDYERIKNTSLAETVEMKALGDLLRISPDQGKALIKRAEAGEPVSAVAEIAAIKQAPKITSAQLIEAWKHSRMLRLWLQATPDAQDELVAYQQQHRKD